MSSLNCPYCTKTIFPHEQHFCSYDYLPSGMSAMNCNFQAEAQERNDIQEMPCGSSDYFQPKDIYISDFCNVVGELYRETSERQDEGTFQIIPTNVNVGPASKLSSLQSTYLNSRFQNLNREIPFASHNECYHIPNLSHGFQFTNSPVCATYLQSDAQSNFEQKNTYRGLSHNKNDVHLTEQLNEWLEEKLSGNAGFVPEPQKINEADEEGSFITSIDTRLNPTDDVLAVACRPLYPQTGFICPVCAEEFSDKWKLKLHSVVHSDKKLFTCHICQKGFTRKWNLKTHMFIHRGDTDAQDVAFAGPSFSRHAEFTCTVCGKEFIEKNYLKQHSVVHSDKKPFTCHVCQKCFKRKPELRSHMFIHRGEIDSQGVLAFAGPSCSRWAQFTCTACGKEFRNKCSLKKHSLVHSDEKPFTCDVCGKGFKEKKNLKFHMLTHSENTFKCDVCGMSFVNTSHLKGHAVVHKLNK